MGFTFFCFIVGKWNIGKFFFQGNKGTIDNKGIIDTYNYLLFLKNFVLVNKLAISERIKNDTEAAALSSQASGLYQELNDPHLSKDSVGGIKIS